MRSRNRMSGMSNRLLRSTPYLSFPQTKVSAGPFFRPGRRGSPYQRRSVRPGGQAEPRGDDVTLEALLWGAGRSGVVDRLDRSAELSVTNVRSHFP